MQHIKDLNNAINTLREECLKYYECDECPMCNESGSCVLDTGEPSDFKDIKENEDG